MVTCHFSHCGAVLDTDNKSAHLRRHVSGGRLLCPVEGDFSPRIDPFHTEPGNVNVGCDEKYSYDNKLYQHFQEAHDPDDLRKPSATPRRPELEPIPPLPQTLPSYMSSTRLVSTENVSYERHQRLGPWVGTFFFMFVIVVPDFFNY